MVWDIYFLSQIIIIIKVVLFLLLIIWKRYKEHKNMYLQLCWRLNFKEYRFLLYHNFYLIICNLAFETITLSLHLFRMFQLKPGPKVTKRLAVYMVVMYKPSVSNIKLFSNIWFLFLFFSLYGFNINSYTTITSDIHWLTESDKETKTFFTQISALLFLLQL